MKICIESTGIADTKNSILKGANLLVHTAVDSLYEPALLSLMKKRSITLVPSLNTLYALGTPKYISHMVLNDSLLRAILTPEQTVSMRYYSLPLVPDEKLDYFTSRLPGYMEVASLNLLAARDKKIVIAIGSYEVPGVYTLVEMELMGKAGLSNREVMYAATYGGAYALGIQKETGSLEKGMLADMLILKADPLENIQNTRHIEYIVKEGIVFSPNEIIHLHE
jgi:hypothetical protein